jgi:hypothetical protein
MTADQIVPNSADINGTNIFFLVDAAQGGYDGLIFSLKLKRLSKRE